MALVLKKKPVIVVANKPPYETSTPDEIVALMEEIGAEQELAEKRIAEMKRLVTLIKPYNEKLKQLAELVTAYAESQEIDPDKEFTEQAEDFILEVGKRGKERRVVSVEKAMKAMGKKVFFEKATVGLGVLDQYLTPEEMVGVVETFRVARSIKLTRRQALDEAAD